MIRTKHAIGALAGIIAAVATLGGIQTGTVNVGTVAALAGIMFALGVIAQREPNDSAEN
jgi:hypothetical protein